ncbi:MAG: hypothetical protein FWG36_08125 [Oscillospiraceae bacterium]|nr:hypothetical protein [Oscillospiraceae bacterium]
MQAYEGFFENGRFTPIGQPVSVKGRRRAVMTVFDDTMSSQAETLQAKAWREFFEAVNASDEAMPETFERVNFTREINL